MIHEIAHLSIDPDKADDFEQAVARCEPLFRRAKGCHGMSLEREIEDPSRYRLRVRWETVEDHMVTFRESEDFQQWRALAGPFFVGTPIVVHVSEATVFF